jgi:hypothetical protein
MWYIVRFLYGEERGGLFQWSKPIEATNPEEAVRQSQDVVWDEVTVYRLAEDSNGDLDELNSEELDVEPPDYPEPGDLW